MTISRSNSAISISAWAATVQPGSPPKSPSAASFFVVHSPTPSTDKFDPNTTLRPPLFVPLPFLDADSPQMPSLSTSKSFSVLRRSRSQKPAPVPSKPVQHPPRHHPFIFSAFSFVSGRRKTPSIHHPADDTKPSSNKKSKKRGSSAPPLPPSLAAEVALMQFFGGGSTEANIKRLMEERARAAGSSPDNSDPTSTTTPPAVADVYRDPTGRIWIDREEQLEYVGLLEEQGFDTDTDTSTDDDDTHWTADWVSFDDLRAKHDRDAITEQRPSVESARLVKPAEDDECHQLMLVSPAALKVLPVPLPLAHTSSSTLSVSRRAQTSPPLLALPSRPRRSRTLPHSYAQSASFLVLDPDELPIFPDSESDSDPDSVVPDPVPAPVPADLLVLPLLPPTPAPTSTLSRARRRGQGRRRREVRPCSGSGSSFPQSSSSVVKEGADEPADIANANIAKKEFLDASFDPVVDVAHEEQPREAEPEALGPNGSNECLHRTTNNNNDNNKRKRRRRSGIVRSGTMSMSMSRVRRKERALSISVSISKLFSWR